MLARLVFAIEGSFVRRKRELQEFVRLGHYLCARDPPNAKREENVRGQLSDDLLLVQSLCLGERGESDHEHDSCHDGSHAAENRAYPVIDEDVHEVDLNIAESRERCDERRELEDEVVRHPHGIPGRIVPLVHISHGSDARPAPQVPRRDGSVREQPPDHAEHDVCDAQLVHFFASIDAIVLVDAPRVIDGTIWARFVYGALDEILHRDAPVFCHCRTNCD